MSQTIVITGANRGIGLELVKRYTELGHQVFALCRKSSPELEKTGATVFEGVEVTDFEAQKKVAAKIEAKVDLLICNAGIFLAETFDKLKGGDFAAIEQQFQVNTLGPLKTLMSFVDHLKKDSKVAMITSRMGSIADNTSGGYYGYRLSKGALNNLCQSLSFDLRLRSVNIGVFHPGWVQTEMTGKTGDLTPVQSSKLLVQRISELNEKTNMGFWHPEGETLPW